MRRRKIGPLPLIGGIQLAEPSGKPTGLLRALNVEARDGYLQRRRGSVPLLSVWNYPGTVMPGTVAPSPWTGASVTYVDVGTMPAPGLALMFALVTGNLGTNEVVDGTITWEFWGEDDAWHTLDVLNLTEQHTGAFFTTQSVADHGPAYYGAICLMVYPEGFKTAQPSGTPSSGNWLRVTRSAGTWATDIAGVILEETTYDQGRQLMALACPLTRTGAGPYAAVRKFFGQTWGLFDVGATGTWFVTGMATGIGSAPWTADDIAQLQYVPATDHLLAVLGEGYYKHTCGTQTTVAFTPEIPDPNLSAYGDIPCRTALPFRPNAACLFGGRVFLGGFQGDRLRIIWSAPDAYWTIWPESNDMRLPDTGGGEILAFVPQDEVLYILTTSGIWRLTLADPVGNSESSAFVDLVENVRISAPRSVAPSVKGVCFLADDGPRIFDGVRSKRLIEDIEELFRRDSAHPFACFNKETAVGVWHPIENQYRLAYRSSGGADNDVMLAIDLDERTAWLHGAEVPAGADASSEASASAPIAQRKWGARWVALAWNPADQRVWGITPAQNVAVADAGDLDMGHRIEWYAETHNLRIAAAEQAVCDRVDLTVARDHFQQVKVSVIPDGDRARADVRNVAVQRDRLDTTAVIGGASLAGNITPLQLDESIAPLVWRGRKKARNHRVRVESIAPTHHPVRIVAMTADLSVEENAR